MEEDNASTSKNAKIRMDPGVPMRQYVQNMPDASLLNVRVRAVIDSSSWWEKYGVDWTVIVITAALLPQSFRLLAEDNWWRVIVGTLLYGCVHSVLANRAAHVAAHGGICESRQWGRFWSRFLIEFVGSFSDKLTREMHIGGHHPHTNIIGLGDSSVWKAPYLDRFTYLFVAPCVVPVLTPPFVVAELYRRPVELAKYLLVAGSGLACFLSVLTLYCGFSLPAALLVLCTGRATCGLSYIHFNIFQHIGLNMWDRKHRPARLFQMSDGVLNLRRNLWLDWVFGHALINCHVEHHLFPKLGDNMCLKIKPIVSSFLKQHGMPYHEDSYWNRLQVFWNNYPELMVDAPPITHFIGLQ